MKSIFIVTKTLLLLLFASFSVASALAQEPESLQLKKEDYRRTPTTNRPIPRERPKPARQQVPPSPPRTGGGGGRGGGGDGGGLQVVLFVSPAIEGEHRIIVPLIPGAAMGSPGEFVGQTLLPIDPPPATAENWDDEISGYRIQDAAVIEQPNNLSVGCIFMFRGSWQDSVPQPIFYGEFLQSPVERINAVYCSTELHSRNLDTDRYGGGRVNT